MYEQMRKEQERNEGYLCTSVNFVQARQELYVNDYIRYTYVKL